jgi:hypothetical protein
VARQEPGNERFVIGTTDIVVGVVIAGGVVVGTVRSRGTDPREQSPWLYTREWSRGTNFIAAGLAAMCIDFVPGVPLVVGFVLGFILLAVGIGYIVLNQIRGSWRN